MADSRITLRVDDEEQSFTADPAMPLLYALRNEFNRKGPKFGCGVAQCGACTVLIDGQPVRSCVMPVAAVTGTVRTLDGLAADGPHPVQQAFIAEEAGQCAYCMSGWILSAIALLERQPDPNDDEIRAALAGLKCRCGMHMAILRAIKRAAREMRATVSVEQP